MAAALQPCMSGMVGHLQAQPAGYGGASAVSEISKAVLTAVQQIEQQLQSEHNKYLVGWTQRYNAIMERMGCAMWTFIEENNYYSDIYLYRDHKSMVDYHLKNQQEVKDLKAHWEDFEFASDAYGNAVASVAHCRAQLEQISLATLHMGSNMPDSDDECAVTQLAVADGTKSAAVQVSICNG